ncbi:hypothetical protein BROUX41_004553 [Berkeleyomyces rouxiae]|uniref:uncharacterized protein n=1 Tax=Berkeleyomyces rouxiae TaxID=2035830 RepID=UPI003B761C7E
MPEIAEVARVVHFLRKHLVSKTIRNVTAVEDPIVLKSDVTAELTGRKILSVERHGKYFWLALDSNKCAVMHLGMTGWVHIEGEKTAPEGWYKKMGTGTEWPPRFWKFHLETEGTMPVKLAYTNSRRIGQIIVVDGDRESVRREPPLARLGLDPVADQVSLEWLQAQLSKRRCPVKAFLLDQTVMCGIGNWVADEVLYHARIHPEELCCDMADDISTRLYDSIIAVCALAVNKLGDESQFPEDWLFKHRWNRGKKGPGVLPNGEALALVTVGGRTSCFAPGRQILTSNPAPKSTKKPSRAKARTLLEKAEEEEMKIETEIRNGDSSVEGKAQPRTSLSGRKRAHVKDESGDERDCKSPHARRTRSQTQGKASRYFT